MSEARIQSSSPQTTSVGTNSSAKASERSNANASVKTQGLERAMTSQTANTKADANRGFTVAPGVTKAEARSDSRVSAKTHASEGVKAGGLVRANAMQGSDTEADSNRDFSVAPGVTKAQSETSLNTNAHAQTNASVNAKGVARGNASETTDAGASTHTSVAGKIKHRLHL